MEGVKLLCSSDATRVVFEPEFVLEKVVQDQEICG